MLKGGAFKFPGGFMQFSPLGLTGWKEQGRGRSFHSTSQ